MEVYGARLNGRPLPLSYFLSEDDSAVDVEKTAPVHPENTKLHGLNFFGAAAAGNFHITAAFLISGVDPNAHETENGKGVTALHYAASSGELAVVRLLTDNGANINGTSPNGQTPLMWAVERGYADMAKFMVNALGADLDSVDEEGQGVAFYGAFSPLTLHTFVKTGMLDVSKTTNRKGQTPLHHVCMKSGTRIPALYFCEMSSIDVNATDNKGCTALHYAVETGDVNLVKALISRGARWDIADGNGFTAYNRPQTTRQMTSLMDRYSNETNNTTRERMCQVDASNWAALDMKQIKHAAVPFLVPNLVVILATTYLPTILALIAAGVAAGGFAMVAKFGMAQKNRSLATAGWFAGSLTFGSIIVVHSVLPTYQKAHEDSMTPDIWVVSTALMFYSYLRAVLADPGAVHGSPEERKTIYENVATVGESEVQRVGYDTTTMVTKPLRAKHCNKTHHTVYRFDHYCVWTGNAIGGGNHRAFAIYSLFQVIAQACVLSMTISFLFTDSPALQKEPVKFSNWCLINNWFFNEENTIVTTFLLMYNAFIFLFVASVAFTQLWYATRNVTSNEVWFADRYKWMFKLGSRAYSLYDQGALKNLIGFFWKDNLCADLHTVPAMNEHLIKTCRKYTNKVKSSQASQQPQQSSCCNNGKCNSNAHPPAAAPVESPITPGNAASPGVGDHAVNYPNNPSSSPLVPQDFNLDHAVKALPEDKQNEMMMVQGMLQQLIAGQDPTPPTNVTQERQDAMLHKARTMHQHYQKAMQMQMQMQQQMQQAQPTPAAVPAAASNDNDSTPASPPALSVTPATPASEAPAPMAKPAKKGD